MLLSLAAVHGAKPNYFSGIVLLLLLITSGASAAIGDDGDDATVVTILDDAECLSKGFDKTKVPCQTCTTLSEYVHDEILLQECRACCLSQSSSKEHDSRRPTYQRAVLEYDPRWTASNGLDRFLARHLPALESRGVAARKLYGVLNRIIFYRSAEPDDTPAETVNVQGWESDLIAEFLSSRMPASPPPVTDEARDSGPIDEL